MGRNVTYLNGRYLHKFVYRVIFIQLPLILASFYIDIKRLVMVI